MAIAPLVLVVGRRWPHNLPETGAGHYKALKLCLLLFLHLVQRGHLERSKILKKREYNSEWMFQQDLQPAYLLPRGQTSDLTKFLLPLLHIAFLTVLWCMSTLYQILLGLACVVHAQKDHVLAFLSPRLINLFWKRERAIFLLAIPDLAVDVTAAVLVHLTQISRWHLCTTVNQEKTPWHTSET